VHGDDQSRQCPIATAWPPRPNVAAGVGSFLQITANPDKTGCFRRFPDISGCCLTQPFELLVSFVFGEFIRKVPARLQVLQHFFRSRAHLFN
jgi:hypothetical protein